MLWNSRYGRRDGKRLFPRKRAAQLLLAAYVCHAPDLGVNGRHFFCDELFSDLRAGSAVYAFLLSSICWQPDQCRYSWHTYSRRKARCLSVDNDESSPCFLQASLFQMNSLEALPSVFDVVPVLLGCAKPEERPKPARRRPLDDALLSQLAGDWCHAACGIPCNAPHSTH